MQRINVLGVGISVINLHSTMRVVGEALARKSKGYVCVTGVHGVMEAQRNDSLRRVLNGSFLNTPDGMPMVWLGKLRGYSMMDRVYGPDLMCLVCELTRKTSYTHFLYGGGPGLVEQLRARLEQRFPGLRIVGAYTPPFRPLEMTEEQEFIEIVRASKPDIIWVGLSTPKQEMFMAEYLQKLDTTLMVGVGAAFDFLAGTVKQAPRWMQRSGLEWLFRLGCEPRRLWRRYLKNNPLFAIRIVCQLIGLRKYSLD